MLRVDAVVRELEKRISGGQYEVGARVPTEPELAKEFAVSRTTIRTAVSDLQARGMLSREQGRGTFVLGKVAGPVNIMLESNLSVTDVIKLSGRQPGTVGLSVSKEIAPNEVLAALQIPDRSKCVVVRRTRTADGIPAADSIDYLLDVPSMPTETEAYSDSIYELLEEIHHQPVETGLAHIKASAASELTASRLAIATGSPILVLSQVHELTNGIPVMYSVISLRSDVVELYVHRGHRGDGSLQKSEREVDQ